MVGRVLGNRYEILELIGEGGMAGVYKARCHLLNRFVAVKILRSEFVTDADFLKKFEKESQASASLSHPNIVNVYDVGTDNDAHYIVMELVNGITLKQYIVNKATYLSTQEIVGIARQIAMALDHAHSNGIVHRDIKPHNILITEDGHIKVADFGIARAATSATIVKTNEALGSVHYASPEQAKGGFIDARSDLYSLGILMFELATGRVPFDGDTPVSIALKHLKEEAVPPSMVNSHVSESLETVIMKLIQKDAGMRYQSAARLVEDLEMIQANPEKNLEIFLRDMDSPTTKLPQIDDFDLGPARKPKKKKSSPNRSNPRISRGMVAMTVVGALLLALLITVPFFFTSIMEKISAKSVVVPDFINQPGEVAEQGLQELGLAWEYTETVEADDIEPGNIVKTDPVAGTKVKEGFTVRITLSSGAPVKVPNVMNKEQQEAEILITNLRLKVGQVEMIYNEAPEGTVVDQEPKGGVTVRERDTVDLKVSQGPEKAKVTMPNLTGKTLEEARAALEELKLKVGAVDMKATASADPNRVLTQSVEQGTETEEGTAVDLVISKVAEGGASGEPQITKPVYIPTNFDSDTEVIKVYLIDAMGISRLVYEKQHAKTENTVKVDIKGSGTGTLKVYYGEMLVYSEAIVFK